jgi:hypothetical protein
MSKRPARVSPLDQTSETCVCCLRCFKRVTVSHEFFGPVGDETLANAAALAANENSAEEACMKQPSAGASACLRCSGLRKPCNKVR